MNASELVGCPVEIEVAGKRYTFKRIGMGRRMAIAESLFVERRIADIRLRSTAFDDPKDRREYVSRMLESIPSGDALAEAVGEMKVDFDVISRWVAASAGISREDAVEVLESAGDNLTAILKVVSPKKASPSPEPSGHPSSGTSSGAATASPTSPT